MMDMTEVEKRLELVHQQVMLLSSSKKKTKDSKPKPIIQSAKLKLRCGNIWGELTLGFPEGYDPSYLETDIFDLVDGGVPIYESQWERKDRPRRRRKKRVEDDE